MGQDISQIDSTEIQKMLHKFGKLDEDESGALSAKEFMQIPELTSNPLVERVIDIFDSDGNGEVFFTETFYQSIEIYYLSFLNRLISLNLSVVSNYVSALFADLCDLLN
jgi:Ca2+-binding EF-hand superfamily protein